MNTYTPPQEFEQHKSQWLAVGEKILSHYRCHKSPEGIGACIDLWKTDKAIDEDEFVNALGFVFGEFLAEQYGGAWVIVEDAFGTALGLQQRTNEYFFPLDAISKRLQDDSEALREIPSLAAYYAESR